LYKSAQPINMTTPVDEAVELLLESKFCLQSIQDEKALKVLPILLPEVNNGLERLSYLLDHTQGKLIAYVEAMRHDRREKRSRYKKNKKKKRLVSVTYV